MLHTYFILHDGHLIQAYKDQETDVTTFGYLLKCQGQSTDYALKYGGYSVEMLNQETHQVIDYASQKDLTTPKYLQVAAGVIRKLADANVINLSPAEINRCFEHVTMPKVCTRAAALLIECNVIGMEQVNNLINADKADYVKGKAADLLYSLKNEINETLLFFCSTDVKLYGHITPGTVQAFNTQNVQFPEILKELVKA